MSQASQKGVSLATTTPRRYRVTFQDDTTWEGTRRELFAMNPDWWKYAVEIQPPVPCDTQEGYSGDVLTQIEQDYADADNPRLNRMPRSAIHYQTRTGQRVHAEWRPGTVVQRRKSALPANETEDVPQVQPRRKRRGLRAHPLVYLGIGGMVALLIWVGAAWVHFWWLNTQDDWKYTSTFRTFSIDQAVGHDGDSQSHPSHFIAQNDDRHIIIIEFPDNDKSKALIYSGPTMLGDGEDKTPVFLSFQLNPQTNRLDMVLHVENQLYIFANNGTKFLEPSV